MRIKTFKNGYVLWLSKNDTYDWAHKPNASWPCSTVSNKYLMINVDSNGLCDLTVNGNSKHLDSIDANELQAIVSDYTLNTYAEKFWPNWK